MVLIFWITAMSRKTGDSVQPGVEHKRMMATAASGAEGKAIPAGASNAARARRLWSIRKGRTMDQLPEYIEGIPNICGAERVVEAAVRSGRDGPVFFRDSWTPFGGVHSAFAIGLHCVNR